LIIDAHTHLIDPPYSHEQLSFRIADGQIIKPNALRDQVTPKQLIQDMDKNNISKSIVIASDPLSNENLSYILKTHPKRLKGFAYINPLEIDSPQQLEHAIHKLGLVGLKLVPDFQARALG
jgi:predicted TIM-barrel fold metal-dependent hydrolase